MDNYKEHVLKTVKEIEAETQQANKGFLDAVVGVSKVKLDASRNKEEKEVIDLVDEIKENEAPIEPDINNLFLFLTIMTCLKMTILLRTTKSLSGSLLTGQILFPAQKFMTAATMKSTLRSR